MRRTYADSRRNVIAAFALDLQRAKPSRASATGETNLPLSSGAVGHSHFVLTCNLGPDQPVCPCGRGLFFTEPASKAQSRSSSHTGAWSLALSYPRTSLSTPAARNLRDTFLLSSR
jgi:hypothetical protein